MVVSKFETHAREIEIDAVADHGELVLWAISEHIEDAGVHSGDATLVLPPQTLYIADDPPRAADRGAARARRSTITGPFNVQFLAKHNAVKVIECNLRASRSFPFVSKVTGENFAAEAMRRMLGVRAPRSSNRSLDLDYVGVKAPMFSFSRLRRRRPDARRRDGRAPARSAASATTCTRRCCTRCSPPASASRKRGVLLSLGPLADKYWFADEARVIAERAAAADLRDARDRRDAGRGRISTARQSRRVAMTVRARCELIERGRVDLVINVPREYDELGRPDGYLIRRARSMPACR